MNINQNIKMNVAEEGEDSDDVYKNKTYIVINNKEVRKRPSSLNRKLSKFHSQNKDKDKEKEKEPIERRQSMSNKKMMNTVLANDDRLLLVSKEDYDKQFLKLCNKCQDFLRDRGCYQNWKEIHQIINERNTSNSNLICFGLKHNDVREILGDDFCDNPNMSMTGLGKGDCCVF